MIRAEIIGNSCTALGLTASGAIELCRKLVAAGYDSSEPMHAYRGDMLCLKVRSIGEGARTEITGHGVGFKVRAALGAASPMRQSASEAPLVPADHEDLVAPPTMVTDGRCG